jgi:tetratricopeptide (TPR) repeat protein
MGLLLIAMSLAAEPEADAAFAAGEFSRAATLYEQVAKVHPSPRVWYQAGLAYHSQSRWAEAAAAMERAVKAGLKQPVALYNAACAQARAGHAEQAIGLLERAIAGSPQAAAGLAQDADLASLRGTPRFVAAIATVEAATHPCRGDPRAHALDFWVGEWVVYSPTGQVVGHSSVRSILDGCVVFENWVDPSGDEGKSFNLFDRTTNSWRQTWVSAQGTQIDFVGQVEGNSMLYRSRQAGEVTRMRFTPFDGGVRQLWEASSDDGGHWSVRFDGRYRPRDAGS